MSELAGLEYRTLRETIRDRGTAKPRLVVTGFAVWAAALLLVLGWLANPIASLVPLLVLVVTFEVIRPLHLAIERIGRYLQVFYEETGAALPGWERTAMAFGPSLPGAGGHPLYLPLFVLATGVNLLAVVLPGPLPIEAGAFIVPHAAFVIWLLYCDRGMRRQRATELTRYRALKQGEARAAPLVDPERYSQP